MSAGKRKRFNEEKKGKWRRSEWESADRNDERHEGSYKLEDIQNSDEYKRRITQVNPVKKKYALCISYLGSEYQGLQINPGAKTVEAELEKALLLSGTIAESNFGYLQKIQWTRAARTDRGVHAMTQCCAMKLSFPYDQRNLVRDQINQFLPSDICIQAITKVAKNFNAHAQCTKRNYNYLLPTYMLQDLDAVNTALATVFSEQGPIKGAGYEGGYVDPSSSKFLNGDSLRKARDSIVHYRIDAERLNRFRSALKEYEGTKSYHNFTVGKDATEANAKRYIISFDCSEPFVAPVTGIEWVLLSVFGQSFLLNQIRKMVGFAVDVCRGQASQEQMQESFTHVKVDVPMAPALGLYLDKLYFDGYNIKQQREMENDKRIAAMRAADSGTTKTASAPDSDTVATTAPSTAQTKEGEDGDDDGDKDDPSNREEIDWYAVAEVNARLDNFRNITLHPHIYQQEIDSASFLYYLDYCRVCKHNYKATPLREEENRGNNNHKKQKAATAEVVEVVLPPAAAIDTTTTIEEQPIAVAEDAPASSE